MYSLFQPANENRRLFLNYAGSVQAPHKFTTVRIRDDFYLLYLIKGQLSVTLGEKTQVLEAGEAFLYPPGSIQKYANASDGEIVYYFVHFAGSEAAAILRECSLNPLEKIVLGVDENIIRILKQICEEMICRDACSDISAEAHLISLFVYLSRKCSALQLNKVNKRRVFDSLLHIHFNYNKEITVRELADLEHLSPSRFTAVFRECMGIPPLSYVIRHRIKNACDLMLSTDLSIREIAQMVGYPDQHYFSRLFKASKGMTPEEYRYDKVKRNGLHSPQ